MSLSGARAVIGLLALAILAALARLHFGVDFTDEAYYAGFPYRFALGDVPYVSDINIHQNAGVISFPFVKLYVLLVGSSLGLMLFLRYLYVGMRLWLMVLEFRFVRRAGFNLPAALAALLPIAFVPFSIPSLSYNTQGGTLFGIGLLLLLEWRRNPRTRVAAGAIVAWYLAGFSYPPMLLAAAIAVVALILLSPTSPARRDAVRAAIVVTVVCALMALATLSRIGIQPLLDVLRFGKSFSGEAGGGPLERGHALLGGLRAVTPHPYVLAVLWLAIAAAAARRRWLAPFIVAAYTLVAMTASTHIALLWVGLASIPLGVGAVRDNTHIAECVAVALSLLIGATAAFFSGNGVGNGVIGLEVACLFTVLWSGRIALRQVTWRSTAGLFATAFVSLMMVLRAEFAQWTDVYRDASVSRLTATVSNGPYAGMRTTPEKLRYLNAIQTALHSYADSSRSILSFNRFPAGGLILPLPPALSTTWAPDYPREAGPAYRGAIARSYLFARRPILVLQLHRLLNAPGDDTHSLYPENDPLMVV
ncbi:MAG: hypothetical protein M3Z10_04220, partial [Gemmatimonadota bacterium]|nr:hypothetical protein [Gemmatimonadota bacterium]